MDDMRLDALARTFYEYFRVLFMEDWNSFRTKLPTDEEYSQWEKGLRQNLASSLKQIDSSGQLPDSYLQDMKNRIDGIDEVSTFKDERDSFLESCNKTKAKLEMYIRQPWRI
jgi:hypothetical protein